jgi:molybdopterin-guanine dinucleotide biosynthesis protein A
MPNVTAEWLSELIDLAEVSNASAAIPKRPSGFAEPLCAVYRRGCLDAVRQSLSVRPLQITDALDASLIRWIPVPQEHLFATQIPPRTGRY